MSASEHEARVDGRRVLIVEDNRRVAELLCELLDDEPDLLLLASCRDAGTAIECAQRLNPDVVLVSGRVGAVSGSALCKVLRRLLPPALLLLWSDAASSAAVRTPEPGSAVDVVLDRGVSYRDLTRTLRRGAAPSSTDPIDALEQLATAGTPIRLPDPDAPPVEQMVLRCPGCDVELCVRVQDMASVVGHVRTFFLTHDGCATTLDLTSSARRGTTAPR